VHFFLPGPYLVGAPVAIAAGVPIKIMSRRSLADYQKNWPGAARFERMLHGRMDAVLANSRAVVDELTRKEGCPESQVRLIYNGLRLSHPKTTRAEARAELGLVEQTFVATVVANLFPYKGHFKLIAALAEIAHKLPRPWRLLCAGRDEGEAQVIARLIVEKGLSENVYLLGERHDVPRLLAASDIGILTPTRNEGLSNAVLESMAAGLPMVVTDVGGNSELVVDGETGFSVPLHDSNSLASAILKLAYDAELRQTMGDKAKRRATEQFSLAACVDQYCSLYAELLARSRTS
jgi:glycosyltransferase involved in cell wall biosynthesis